MRAIVTAQPAALPIALREAGNPQVLHVVAPGVALCEGIGRVAHPVFLRHIAPAEIEISLTGGPDDVTRIGEAAAPLLGRLSSSDGGSFSVQTRILDGFHPEYKRFDVNTALADLAIQAGAALDVKNPTLVLSVTLADTCGWLGLSRAEENLSAWAGGARRFKMEAGQISRAEFKLLEALETFHLLPQDGQSALDLGAAPGGWTRVMRRRGLYVTAVDPAALDPKLSRDKRVTHCRETAQVFFRRPVQGFDWMLNDMKMDSRESALLMVEGARCLNLDGYAVLTLKLPEDATEWASRVDEAQILLRQAYDIIGMRQLFHNRNEVTVCLRRIK